VPIAPGPAKTPFDFGMFGLGGGKANEPAVHGQITGINVTGPEVANGRSRDLEDPAGVALTKVDEREQRQIRCRNLSGRPRLSLRAERFAIHTLIGRR
jgi:hypothetical protein